MEDLDQTCVFMNPVINANWGMEYLSNVDALANWRSDLREVLQDLNMVEERRTKCFRSGLIVGANVVEDIF